MSLAAPHGDVTSDTLVARDVRMSGNTTVKVDARPGRLLANTLNAAETQLESLSGVLCARPGGRRRQPFIEFMTGPLRGAQPGHLYVVPARPKDLMLGYQA